MFKKPFDMKNKRFWWTQVEAQSSFIDFPVVFSLSEAQKWENSLRVPTALN